MSRAAQRQGNYRMYCEKQMAYLRESLEGQPAKKVDAHLADFQVRLDEMFARVPAIADNEANFDNACKHVAYQMALDSDELTDEQKAQFTEQRMDQIAKAPKNWAAIAVIVVIVIVVIVLLVQLPKLL